jgi:hypothetical protein
MNYRMLRLETLESRQVMSGWGNPWPEPERLTVSFAPDGADVGGRPSELFEKLDSAAPREVWQPEALRAFQTWAQHANINFSLVEDNGLPFGIATPAQGAPQWGDIRIGASGLSHAELAVGSPFDLFNNWSGDVVLNSQYNFRTGIGAGIDLFTVMLQEAGHALSLPNSDVTTSAMYTVYQGVRTDLAASDIAAITALYSPRSPDRFDAVQSNGSFEHAAALRFVYDYDQLEGGDGAAGNVPFVAAADLTTRTDEDFYQFELPADLNDFHVELRATGISLLNARVSVFDEHQQLVAQAEGTNALETDVSVFVGGATPGSRYYVRVEGALDDAFAVGAYRLAVGKEAHEAVFPTLPEFIDDDRGDDDDDDLDGLIDLESRTATVGPLWDANYRASLSFTTDSDYYRIAAPEAVSPATALHVAVWGLDPGKLDAHVSVFADPEFLHELSSEILRDDGNSMVLQLRDVTLASSYYVKVSAADPQGGSKEGNYLLGADFRASPVRFSQIASAVLSESRTQQDILLRVDGSAVHHLRVSATALGAGSANAALTILDSQQREIASLVVNPGAPRTLTVLLQPGQYTMRLHSFTTDVARPSSLSVRIAGVIVTDPLGPTLRNPILNPIGPDPGFGVSKRRWTSLGGIPPKWSAPRVPIGDPSM